MADLKTTLVISAQDDTQGALTAVANSARKAATEIGSMASDAAQLAASAGDLAPELQSLGEELAQLSDQQELIGEFVNTRVAADSAKEAFEQAQIKAQALGKAFAGTAAPTQAMVQQFKAARVAVKDTEAEWQKQALALQNTRRQMAEVGVSSTSLAAAQTQINSAVKEGKEKLETYKQKVSEAADAEQQRTAELREAAAEQERVTSALATSLDNAFADVGVRSAAAVKAEIERINQALQKLGSDARVSGAEFDRAWQSGQAQLDKLQAELDGTGAAARGTAGDLAAAGRSAGGLGSMAAEATTYLKGMALAFGAQQVLQIASSMESLRAGLSAVAGDAEKAAQEMDFIKSVASQSGVDVQSAAQAYLSLAAATKGTAVEGQATREVFAAVSAAMATAGKSSAETQNALTALAQMAGKGVVSMEELRGQLGEALPGAMNAAAKGLGITTKELIKLTESGTLTADQLFPALVKGLDDLYGAGKKTGQTLGQEFANIKNAFVDLIDNIQNSGGFDGLKVGAEIAQAAIVLLDVALVGIGKTIGTLAAAIATLDFSGLPEAFAEIEREASDKLNKAAVHNDTLRNAMGLSAWQAKALAGEMSSTAASAIAVGDAATAATPAVQGMAKAAGDVALKAAEAALQLGTGLPEALSKIDGSQLQQLADATLVTLRQEVDFAAQAIAGLAQVQAHANTGLAAADAAYVALLDSGAATQSQLEAAAGAMLAANAQVRATADAMAAAQDVARQKTEAFNAAVEALGARAAQILGVDLVQYSARVSAEFTQSSQALDALIGNFGALKSAGVDAGGAVTEALGNMAARAANTAELDALRAKLTQLGKDGKLSADQVASALGAINERFDLLTPGINSVAEAFRALRVTSDAELRAAADGARSAIEQIVRSGTASARELQVAFSAYAEKAIAANNGVASATLKTEASMRGLRIEVDASGQAVVRSMTEAAEATTQAAAAADRAAGSYTSMAAAAKQAADSMGRIGPNLAEGPQRQSYEGSASSPVLAILNRAEQLGGLALRKKYEEEYAQRSRRQGMRVASFGGADYAQYWQGVADALDKMQMQQEGSTGKYQANAPRVIEQQPREQVVTHRVAVGIGAGRSTTINTASAQDAAALVSLLRQLEADALRS
jgi:tape measure domain-containing protein